MISFRFASQGDSGVASPTTEGHIPTPQELFKKLPQGVGLPNMSMPPPSLTSPPSDMKQPPLANLKVERMLGRFKQRMKEREKLERAMEGWGEIIFFDHLLWLSASKFTANV